MLSEEMLCQDLKRCLSIRMRVKLVDGLSFLSNVLDCNRGAESIEIDALSSCKEMLFNGLSFLSKDAIRCESSLSMDLSNVLDCERGAESIKRDALSNCKELPSCLTC